MSKNTYSDRVAKNFALNKPLVLPLEKVRVQFTDAQASFDTDIVYSLGIDYNTYTSLLEACKQFSQPKFIGPIYKKIYKLGYNDVVYTEKNKDTYRREVTTIYESENFAIEFKKSTVTNKPSSRFDKNVMLIVNYVNRGICSFYIIRNLLANKLEYKLEIVPTKTISYDAFKNFIISFMEKLGSQYGNDFVFSSTTEEDKNLINRNPTPKTLSWENIFNTNLDFVSTIKYDGIPTCIRFTDKNTYIYDNIKAVQNHTYKSINHKDLSALQSYFEVTDVILFGEIINNNFYIFNYLIDADFIYKANKINNYGLNITVGTLTLKKKQFFNMSTLKSMTWHNLYQYTVYYSELIKDIPNDGIILNTVDGSTIYKVKPVKQCSVDLMVKLFSDKYFPTIWEGSTWVEYSQKEVDKTSLFKITNNAYSKYFNEKNIKDLILLSVYELIYSDADNKWVVLRLRIDKDTPNNRGTCDDNSIKKINQQTLFGNDLSVLRKKNNRYKDSILSQIHVSTDVIVDIGSGRGSDINKWDGFLKKKHTNKVIAVEPNSEYFGEFKKRLSEKKLYKERIICIEGTFQNKIDEIFKHTQNKIVTLTNFFVAHFFCESAESLTKFILGLVKINPIQILTVVDDYYNRLDIVQPKTADGYLTDIDNKIRNDVARGLSIEWGEYNKLKKLGIYSLDIDSTRTPQIVNIDFIDTKSMIKNLTEPAYNSDFMNRVYSIIGYTIKEYPGYTYNYFNEAEKNIHSTTKAYVLTRLFSSELISSQVVTLLQKDFEKCYNDPSVLNSLSLSINDANSYTPEKFRLFADTVMYLSVDEQRRVLRQITNPEYFNTLLFNLKTRVELFDVVAEQNITTFKIVVNTIINNFIELYPHLIARYLNPDQLNLLYTVASKLEGKDNIKKITYTELDVVDDPKQGYMLKNINDFYDLFEVKTINDLCIALTRELKEDVFKKEFSGSVQDYCDLIRNLGENENILKYGGIYKLLPMIFRTSCKVGNCYFSSIGSITTVPRIIIFKIV